MPDVRLGRSRRISKAKLISQTIRSSRGYAGSFMVLRTRTGPDADLRLAVIAGKRSLRRSVDRSRAKRLLREAYRLNRHRFRAGFDVVLIARRRILGAGLKTVECDLLELAGRAGIVAGRPGVAEEMK